MVISKKVIALIFFHIFSYVISITGTLILLSPLVVVVLVAEFVDNRVIDTLHITYGTFVFRTIIIVGMYSAMIGALEWIGDCINGTHKLFFTRLWDIFGD